VGIRTGGRLRVTRLIADRARARPVRVVGGRCVGSSLGSRTCPAATQRAGRTCTRRGPSDPVARAADGESGTARLHGAARPTRGAQSGATT